MTRPCGTCGRAKSFINSIKKMKLNFYLNISVFFLVSFFLNTGCKNNEPNSRQTVQISQTTLDSLNAFVSESNAASQNNSTQENPQTVTIGSQVWTSKNLDVVTYRNGDVIPQVQDQNAWTNLRTGAWCYFNNDASNSAKYGKLYNWYAVNDPRGLAPKGFHIPSYAEWSILSDYLGETAGTKMKSRLGWFQNGNGTNSSRFEGLPGGYRYHDGAFTSVGIAGYWWSSVEHGTLTNCAYVCYLNCYYGYFYNGSYSHKESGNSVRCIRD